MGIEPAPLFAFLVTIFVVMTAIGVVLIYAYAALDLIVRVVMYFLVFKKSDPDNKEEILYKITMSIFIFIFLGCFFVLVDRIFSNPDQYIGLIDKLCWAL